MSPYTLQLIILVGAYVVSVLSVLAAGLLAFLNWRAVRSLETKKSDRLRLTALESEMKSHRDLVASLSARWSSRLASERRTRKKEEQELLEDDPQPTGSREELVTSILGRKNAV